MPTQLELPSQPPADTFGVVTKLVLAVALVGAYMEAGWIGVVAGIAGCALVWIFVLVYAIRHGETEIDIER